MEQSSILYAILLGIIQGIAEFLPISSSGHLIIFSWLVNDQPLPIALNVALHLGTLFAILIYFRSDWWQIFSATKAHIIDKKPSHTSQVILPAIIIGSIPAAFVGLIWKDAIEAIFHNPLSTVLPLALVGIALWYTDIKFSNNRTLEKLTIKDGLIIGIAQACALIPGVSRSGATIIAARCLNINRNDAARFSFLLGTPAMGGAALLHGKELYLNLTNDVFIVGFISSFLVGYLAIKFFLAFLKRFGFLFFAIYRLILAAIIGALILL